MKFVDNLSVQLGLLIIIILFGLIFIASSFWRLSIVRDKALRTYDLLDLICGVSLVTASAILYLTFANYIPANSTTCQAKPISYGMINYGVSITGFEEDSNQYPATSFTAAEQAYLTSKNGPKTGYFAWNGSVVQILNSQAYNLGSSVTTVGSWMVFGDLNNVAISSTN